MMKNSVLFVLQKYNDSTAQNAICIKGIISELEEHNIDVDVLSLEYCASRSTNNVYVVDNYCENTILKRLYEITHIPLHNRHNILNIYQEAEALFKRKKYSTIISVMNPTEAVDAIAKLKKKYKFDFFIFEIDPASNRYKTCDTLFKKYWRKKSTGWEYKVYDKADCILHMISHKKHFDSSKYANHVCKSVYIDIPCVSSKKIENENFTSLTNTNGIYIYAGAFYPGLREPDYMVSVFEKFLNSDCESLNIFTRYEYVDLINKKTISQQIRAFNVIDQNELIKIQKNALALVSVGNKDSDFLPSKTIQYISTGKPIIHFYYDESDVSIPYFDKYGNAICIKIGTDIEVACRKINLFMSEKHSIENKNYISNEFRMNTFEFAADIIMRSIPVIHK